MKQFNLNKNYNKFMRSSIQLAYRLHGQVFKCTVQCCSCSCDTVLTSVVFYCLVFHCHIRLSIMPEYKYHRLTQIEAILAQCITVCDVQNVTYNESQNQGLSIVAIFFIYFYYLVFFRDNITTK